MVMENNSFITHDWGVDEKVVIEAEMPQSIKLRRPNGDYYFQAPQLIKNHQGSKKDCHLCKKI